MAKFSKEHQRIVSAFPLLRQDTTDKNPITAEAAEAIKQKILAAQAALQRRASSSANFSPPHST